MKLNLTEDGRPIGHDGKAVSVQAWQKAHGIIARIEARISVRTVNEEKGA